ncbi:MAG: polyamine aminopropyltransferase [Lentisphaeria bacterium]|nr:polyamine aminopropyltransferase [Lentisphaeria bacterium]
MEGNWITEAANGYGQTIEVTRTLCSRQSRYQKIEVYETRKLGRLLLLDGIIQLTSADEFAYQEMMAHLPYYVHGAPENVLVIGGGDGGVLRELGRHPGIRQLDLCEIDFEVIRAAQEFLPELACGFNDPRVRVNIADGSEYVKSHPEEYDLIIVDSTDPGGPGAPLFTADFYADLKRALRPGGVAATQAESPWLLPDVVGRLLTAAGRNFLHADYAAISVPTYPTGMIGCCVASDDRNPAEPAREPEAELARTLRYYNAEVHRAAFAKPQFVKRILSGESRFQG